MEKIKFSIVIPTRERADTLFHTIATCTSQDYDNLEIIVSDNFSNDNTRDVVLSFQDKRITYINTNKRLGMSSNWEFGLSHVTGDFVMFLGDDDGLLPNAVKDIANILSEHKYPAIIWQKPDYNWPTAINMPNYMSVSLSNKIFIMNGAVLLYLISKGFTSYGKLPVIYSGFVSTVIVAKIRKKSGKFFCSVTPDIYSGFALTSQIKYYIYSFRPFSVNGGSHHSHGYSNCDLKSEITEMFFSENDIPQHPKMNAIPGSMNACVTEALLQANDHCFNGRIKVNLKRAIKRVIQEIANEIANKDVDTYNNGIAILKSLDLDNNFKNYILHCQKIIPDSRNHQKRLKLYDKPIIKDQIYLAADKFGITNIHEACQFIGNILGRYTPPKTIPTFSALNYVYTLCNRYLNRFFEKRSF